MKKHRYIFLIIPALFLCGCTEKIDPNVLSNEAKSSLEKFVGEYNLLEMRWIGPDIDTDMDGICDTVFHNKQVVCSDSDNYLLVKEVNRLDEMGFFQFGFPVSQLKDYNAGYEYSWYDPQLFMLSLMGTYFIDAKGEITMDVPDFDCNGQYLKNFVFEFMSDSLRITAEGHLWDFFTNQEVKGKYQTTYRKKQ